MVALAEVTARLHTFLDKGRFNEHLARVDIGIALIAVRFYSRGFNQLSSKGHADARVGSRGRMYCHL